MSAALAVKDTDLGEKLRVALADRAEVSLGLVFGSRARGAGGPASDLDVAVMAPGPSLPAIAAALSRASGLEVDVISLEDPGVPMLEQLVRDAQPIYEATPGLGAAWRSRALATLELDGPWYARMRDAWLARVARNGL